MSKKQSVISINFLPLSWGPLSTQLLSLALCQSLFFQKEKIIRILH